MKRQWWILMALVATTPCLALWPSHADEPGKLEEGWISLFNGKDLAGWKNAENGQFTVEDGKIKVTGKRAHLFSEQEFKNFEFKAEIMTTPGSNSGVFFHTKFQEEGWPVVGYESQVNVTHTDPVKTGSIYYVVKLYQTPAKDDEWWTQHITVKGKNVQVRINDELVLDFTEPDGVTGTRKLGKGSFALQAHDPKSVVYFRNIRVKPLPD